VETTQPGNIGATARAMDNMGVTDLRLVNPCAVDHPEARMFAMGARYIMQQARIYPDLRAAVADRRLVIGTSARMRDKIQTSRSLHEFTAVLAAHPPDLPIALVFGPEQSGLTNADMSLCNEWVHIPTFGRVNSLNLAQSVVVCLYEISRRFEVEADPSEGLVPASSAQVEGMKDHLFRILERTGFLRNNAREALWTSFAGLIGRARPDDRDVKMIRGFFNRIEVTLNRAERQKPS
jgi:tRNA/rRNA methyltransferase